MRRSIPDVSSQAAGATGGNPWLGFFAGAFGALFGLALLKFGNPCLFDKLTDWPTNGYEWALNSWPVVIGYWALAGVAVIGLFVVRWRRQVWLSALPLAWLAWQLIAGTRTESAELTHAALKHFVACVACFYLGLLALSRLDRPFPFLAGLAAGLTLVTASGFQQHFGGLDQMRQYFFTYVYPQMREVPAEYLKRMNSNRIFSTLFYPNALAGALLLLLPLTLATLWSLGGKKLTPAANAFVAGLIGLGGLACLYWSGSKGGWLLALALGVCALVRSPGNKRIKAAILAAVLLAGVAGFAWKYSEFFRRGAPSVGSRFDCWRAALQTAEEKPFFGTGPGTFAIAYQRVKRPEAEMSRLTHNDYLEQASDSGWPGFVLYSAFVVGALAWSFWRQEVTGSWLRFAVWLGVLGWALQGLFEFGLYIPALAWPAFALMGWLLGIDSTSRPSPARLAAQ